ncbi:Nitric-oxide reductase (EC, quinol-dependent [uncultured Gammaproteobacteria bacterium]|nr:Nitric-oxide reductase (EC, quinol-dependent [uncultured Gammaproteobacteria bacterium]
MLYLGGQIYQQAPPIPNAVQIVNGNVIYSKQDIEDGQNIWQTIGGMQQGSIWGHGSYLALIGAQIGYIERPYLC